MVIDLLMKTLVWIGVDMGIKARVREYIYNANNEIILRPGDVVDILGDTFSQTFTFVTLKGQKMPLCVQIANLDIIA